MPPSTLPLFKVFMAPSERLMPRLERVLYSGQIGEGEAVAALEAAVAARTGPGRTMVAMSSATAALHVALILAGVKPGDEVVSTPATALPTNMAIVHAGARAVWADVDPANGMPNAGTIAAALTPRTRAIMLVHYAGMPAPLAEIRALAAARGLPVIEDAAHALGARYGGEPIGSHSEFVAFSFQAIKHLTTGDGGVLSIADGRLGARARRLRWFGLDRGQSRLTGDVAETGFKYNMNDITATLGLVQFEQFEAVTGRHIGNGRFFDRALAGIPGLELCRWDAVAEPSYWLYTVLAEDRDGLARKLGEAGIVASPVHRRNDEYAVFADSRRELPGLDTFARRVLHLPCGWWVGDEDREAVADTIRRGW